MVAIIDDDDDDDAACAEATGASAGTTWKGESTNSMVVVQDSGWCWVSDMSGSQLGSRRLLTSARDVMIDAKMVTQDQQLREEHSQHPKGPRSIAMGATRAASPILMRKMRE